MSKKWLGFTALLPGGALVFLDGTILPVALPTIQRELHASNLSLEWCINIYLLVLSTLVMLSGKLVDKIGHRSAYLMGMILFVAASFLCGFSSSIGWLIAARGFQGVGAALMYPATTSLLSSLFPPQERGRAIGINVSICSVFMILGPLIGGALTETLSWRWIFWINFPLVFIGIALVLLYVSPTASRDQKIDFIGCTSYIFAASLSVFLVMEIRSTIWSSAWLWPLLFLVLSSFIALFWQERRAKHPFLDLSLFKNHCYRAAVISVGATQFMIMITVFWAIYFQHTLGYSPQKAGSLTFVSSLPVVFMGPVAGFLADRFTAKLPIALGFILMIFSFCYVAFFNQSPLAVLFPGLIAFGMSMPMILTPSSSTAMNSVPPHKIGSAGGMLATVRFLSGTLGVAFMGAVIDRVDQYVMQHGTSVGAEGLQVAAQVDGFFVLHLVLAACALIGFAIVFVLFKPKGERHIPTLPAEGWD